ncbi:AAA family ATPase [Leptospira ognonensis]|uniref:AAA family ATPase n=1 Tax=Leptospira ognonensis TaxID=2484945 RepID=A0A4V3JQU9_9LEPT|nr:AAA family ATPase [Leptospira ognonensis]TGL57346.1 AAA family ATPase [Leptospira ognonensis]
MSNPSSHLDFFKAKELLLSEIGSAGFEFLTEKEEQIFKMTLADPGKEKLFDCLGIIRNYIENFRVYNFENGYFSLQGLNENLFEPEKNLSNKIRFRFSFTSNLLKFEASKRSDFSFKELQACIALYKFFLGTTATQRNPKEILTKLGVEVFDPVEEKVSGNLLSFENVYGYENVKEQILESLVMPILNPKPFQEITKLTRKIPGSILPRAVLFEGDPGVGKTTMAKIAACVCNVPMIYVPIESILSKYYGESSQNLAMVFDAASLFDKSMLFLDEIDSLATSREDGLFEATRNLLSVLLRKLDGFADKGNTITIGATNRKKDLDPALLSRFDRKIFFPLPNQTERAQILEGYAKQLSEESRLRISLNLEGASGRNLKDFCDYVERRWITRSIANFATISAPPTDFYLESLPDFRWK